MKEINIFIRKKSTNYHHSVERFADSLTNISNIKNFRINIKKCPVTSKGFFRRLFLVFWSFFNQGDVNHILGDINFISILMKKNITINTFLDCRLLNEFNGLKRWIYNFFWFQLPINNSKYNTFISEFTKLEIQKNIKKKIILPKVIPVPLVEKLSFKINNNKKKKILIIGTLEHKNIKNMLKGIKGLYIDLTIVGKLEEQLEKFCKKNDINFKNFVEIKDSKIKQLFKKNDILLMVSNYEGFGMPIIEAQASGMAVITSNLEPMRSVAGKYGFLGNPNKPQEIKKIIKKLISNKNFFLKIARKGKYNSSKYASNLVNKKYENLYLKILKDENHKMLSL